MKFNPNTKNLYTDSGKKIKQLSCPKNVQWETLGFEDANFKNRVCFHCDKSIIDTENLNDTDLLNLIKEDEHTCFKIDFNQENVIIINNDIQ
jgi:hypothetical protein